MLRKLQQEAFTAWENSGRKGVVVLPTGTGKSFVGLEAAVAVKKSKENPRILFLAETNARWPTLSAEIIKYDRLHGNKLELLVPLMETVCYQSAYKYVGKHYDLVICDEIHSSISEKYKLFYENNTWDAIIGLTATPRLDKELAEEFYSKIPIVHTSTVEEAIESGAILDYNLEIIEHKLDNRDKYIEAGSKLKKFKTTEESNYKFLNSSISKAYYTGKEGLVKLLIARRANFLYNLKSKRKIVKLLLLRNKGKKIIIFANSLEFLESVCDHVVRGSDPSTIKYIDDFNEGRIDVIGSFKMLEQGVNLTGANVAIIASYFSIQGKFTQRIGRVLRKDSDKPDIYVIKTVGTVEERWFDKMLDE
jgi:superfamily II DNA or RNA helicase